MLAQYSNTQSSGLGVVLIVYLAVIVLYVAGMWGTFSKAGQPGWAAIIPIYNWYVLLKVAGRPGWWLLLFLVPLVNVVILFIVAVDVAKSFGKGTGFGVGLVLLGFVFWPMLGFGGARYLGPAAPGQGLTAAVPPPPPPPAP